MRPITPLKDPTRILVMHPIAPLKNINDVVVFEVLVSQHHIEVGRRNDCNACPIALALNDVLKPEYQSSAGKYSVIIYPAGFRKLSSDRWKMICDFGTPVSARRFMDTFDKAYDLSTTSKRHVFVGPREILREGVQYRELAESQPRSGWTRP